MPFQTQVNQYPAPGVEGARASNNPVVTIVAGSGSLQAGAAGVRVGGFAWNTSAGLANSFCLTGLVPDGFIGNEQQALITTFLAETGMLVPYGYPVTEFGRGDFFAKSVFTEAATGNKVFANLLTGKIMAGVTGTFPVTPSGASGTISVSGTTAAGVMTVTTTSVYLSKGMAITDPTKGGYPVGCYISSQVSGGAGSTGTYQLTNTMPAAITVASTTVVATAQDCGGATTSSCSASTGSATMTVNTVTNGSIYVGQLVKATSVPTGTYVSALGTYTDAIGNGTITLSAVTTDTISTAAVLFSPWIETPWYVLSNGNVGDLIKIGVHN